MFKLELRVVVFSLGICLQGWAFPTSPWHHAEAELAPNELGVLPIVTTNRLDREREQWGYHPRFMPALCSEHPSGYYAMRVGVLTPTNTVGENAATYPSRFFSAENYIQLGFSSGPWQGVTDHVDALRSHLNLSPSDPLEIQAGERVPDALEFADSGEALTLCMVRYAKNGASPVERQFVLYSSGNLHNWTVSERVWGDARINPYRVHADHSALPVIVTAQNGITLLIPSRAGGALELESVNLVPASAEPVLHGVMAGAGARCITANGKSFVVYMSKIEEPGYSGTPQYMVQYDHATQQISGPVFLGTTGDKIDVHNTPVIDLDSKGYLHVIGGAHWHSFRHWVGTTPFSISGWTAGEFIAGNGDNNWSRDGLTYPGFVIDQDDTLHLVARGRNSILKANDPADPSDPNYSGHLDYALVYLRKRPGQSWEARKDLAIPDWLPYSNWYHKIGINRAGNRILATYYYYAHNLTHTADMKALYEAKWGNELTGGVYTDAESRAHDPVLIQSDTGGDSWKITTTERLFPSPPVVDDGKIIQLEADSGGLSVIFNSTSNHLYQIQSVSNLISGDWAESTPLFAATHTVTSKPVAALFSTGFFKVIKH